MQTYPADVMQDAEKSAFMTKPGSNLRVLVGVLGAATFFIFLVWSPPNTTPALTWLAALIVSQVLRMVVELRVGSAPERPLPVRRRAMVVMGAMSGLVQAAAVLLFLQSGLVEQSLLTLILLSMVAGAVVYTAGHPLRYGAYMLPITVSLVLMWAMRDMPAGERAWLGWAMAALIVVYGFNVWGYAQDTWAIYLNATQLRRLEQERNTALEQAVAQSEAANRAKTRFIASASHDLRQPIHTIALLVSVLKLKHPQGDSADAVRLLDSVTISLAQQLDDLLDISKLDAGVMPVQRAPLALGQFLAQRVSEFSSQAEAAQLSLQLDVARDCVVNTDAMLLERVIRNLLSNALKFTPSGSIRVTLEGGPHRSTVTIQDTGIGIAESDQAQIFDEFVQLDNPGRDRSKGLGLGLSIVKRLCRLLDIDLQLQSTPARGTRIELRFQTQHSQIDAPPAPVSSSIPSCFDLKILVLDDEPMVLQSMSMLLHEMGCEAITASDIDTAMDQAMAVRPDLFIADHRLSGHQTGVDAVRLVRGLYPDLPAVLVSGDVAPEQLKDIEASGLRLLHKPMTMDQLQNELLQISSGYRSEHS